MRGSIGVISVVLVVVGVGVGYGMSRYYYDTATAILENNATVAISRITENADNTNVNLKSYTQSLVERFDQKEQMEMMLVDYNGKVVETSSGFLHALTEPMDDYEQAMESENQTGSAVFTLQSGERVLSYTAIIPVANSTYHAVRYMVSTEKLDEALLAIYFFLAGGIVVILVLLLISNYYFIRSIVYPVKELTQVARGFAAGDLDARIVKHTDDEIGQLCDVLNFMADEMQKTEQMQNEFISSVSHELRTPLTAIRGWGETLAATGPDDEQMRQNGMQVILKETERLSVMVEELLDFSRIQNGKLALSMEKMDLLAELEDAVLIYTERARRDGKKLYANAPEELPFIFGDRNRIKQVFINIIDNGLKYSDPGGVVTVDVKTRGEVVIVRITDTGCGIEAKDMPRIKEKFFKANVTRRGSGIGLAVADELVMLHHGHLVVESEASVGTTVTISLPTMHHDIWNRVEESGEERSTERAEG